MNVYILLFLNLFLLNNFFLYSDVIQERPIENRNLYIPNIFFFEPYPTTPQTIGEKKTSFQAGYSISNMIDNNNALIESNSYSKFKPFYWDFIAEQNYNSKLNLNSYIATEYYLNGKIEQQKTVFIDLEVQRGNFKFAYGLTKKIEIGVEITALSYNKGIFDKGIDGFHKMTATPYPIRDVYPDNSFHFIITDNTKILFNAKPRTGLGDSIADLKWMIREESTYLPMISFIGGIKIPTGSFSNLMSSGRFDGSIGISMKKKVYDFFFFWNSFANTNNQFFKSTDIKTTQTYSTAFTIGYHLTNKWAPIIQIEYKTSPYRTDIYPLYQPAVILSFGFNYKNSDSCSTRLNLAEDPYVVSRTVPDISAQINLYCLN